MQELLYQTCLFNNGFDKKLIFNEKKNGKKRKRKYNRIKKNEQNYIEKTTDIIIKNT